MNKTFSYNSNYLAVNIRLLFNPRSVTVTSKKKTSFVVYFKMAPQRYNRMNASALLREGHKVSEVSNLVGVFRTIVYAIKKRRDDGEGDNRRAGSG